MWLISRPDSEDIQPPMLDQSLKPGLTPSPMLQTEFSNLNLPGCSNPAAPHQLHDPLITLRYQHVHPLCVFTCFQPRWPIPESGTSASQIRDGGVEATPTPCIYSLYPHSSLRKRPL